MSMRDWHCPRCGQEVIAREKPEPMRWTDGHTCYFVEGLDTTLARNAPPVLGGFTKPTRPSIHRWEPLAPYCSCGQDTVTCQGCGKLVCGSLAVWRTDLTKNDHAGNIGPCCFAKFGLGHHGTEPIQKGTNQ